MEETVTPQELSPAPAEPSNPVQPLPPADPAPESGFFAAPTAEAAAPPPRDWLSEWKELADAHPEVVRQPMPEDIYEACLQSELPPLRVYESRMLAHLSAELEQLKAENAALRQNADAASRAPVTPGLGGPAAEPEDDFLRGFNYDRRHS